VGLGVALGCLAHAGALALALRRLDSWAPDGPLLHRLARTSVASLLLGLALILARAALPPSAGALALLCLGGLAFYGAAAWILGALTRHDLALLTKKP
jgi:hypothetical protein